MRTNFHGLDLTSCQLVLNKQVIEFLMALLGSTAAEKCFSIMGQALWFVGLFLFEHLEFSYSLKFTEHNCEKGRKL